MNYYLTPQAIAEELNLTAIRKRTSEGIYLLSEYDLTSYGIEKAIAEGAVELSNNLPPISSEGQQTGQEPPDVTSQEQGQEQQSDSVEEETDSTESDEDQDEDSPEGDSQEQQAQEETSEEEPEEEQPAVSEETDNQETTEEQ